MSPNLKAQEQLKASLPLPSKKNYMIKHNILCHGCLEQNTQKRNVAGTALKKVSGPKAQTKCV